MYKLLDFLASHPSLKISSLEREAGMPLNTLANAMNGTRELPTKWIAPLSQLLQQYGFVADTFEIEYSTEAEAQRLVSAAWGLMNEKEIEITEEIQPMADFIKAAYDKGIEVDLRFSKTGLKILHKISSEN